MDDGLLTVAEACRFLRVSRSFLYGMMAAGEITYVQLGRAGVGLRRIPRRAVMDFASGMQTYLILARRLGRVKIGKSTRPSARFAALVTANADDLELLATKSGDYEAYLHEALDTHRVQGEWFECNEAVCALLEREFQCVIPRVQRNR